MICQREELFGETNKKVCKWVKKTLANINNDLLSELKALRRELAIEKNVPAYIIFSDATLIDMCKKLPGTLQELLDVSGVGKVKLELYGDKFLQILKSYRWLITENLIN